MLADIPAMGAAIGCIPGSMPRQTPNRICFMQAMIFVEKLIFIWIGISDMGRKADEVFIEKTQRISYFAPAVSISAIAGSVHDQYHPQ